MPGDARLPSAIADSIRSPTVSHLEGGWPRGRHDQDVGERAAARSACRRGGPEAGERAHGCMLPSPSYLPRSRYLGDVLRGATCEEEARTLLVGDATQAQIVVLPEELTLGQRWRAIRASILTPN